MAITKHEHFGDLFTPQQFHATQQSGDMRASKIKGRSVKSATDQVLKVLITSELALPKSNSTNPIDKANFRIRESMYKKITEIIKENDPPWNYNDIMRESLQFLRTKHPDRINSFYLNNPPNKFEDLFSTLTSSLYIPGKENVFSKWEIAKSNSNEKMDKKQLEILYKEFEEAPRINRSVIDVSISSNLFKKLKETLGGHPLNDLQGDGTDKLLTYIYPDTEMSADVAISNKRVKNKRPIFRGIDVVPSMLEHIEGASLAPHTQI